MPRQRNIRKSAPRRLTQWLAFELVLDSLGGAGTSVLMATLNVAALAIRPFTIVRTRGVIFVGSDQSSASEDYAGVFSAQVVTEAATTVGITAVPTPLTDTNADFYVYEPFLGRASLQTVTATGENFGGSFHFDSKAMRKVDSDDDVAFVVQSTAASPGLDIRLVGRFLIKLH